MQLIAYGAQDLYLTGNPEITFFKVLFVVLVFVFVPITTWAGNCKLKFCNCVDVRSKYNAIQMINREFRFIIQKYYLTFPIWSKSNIFP